MKAPLVLNDDSKLSQQYGGRHVTGWVDSLPTSWVPYIQLARLSPPVGVCLVLFPHVFGFLHGILLLRSSSSSRSWILSGSPSPPAAEALSPSSSSPSLDPWSSSYTAWPAALLVAGSFFFSNAIHGWNDLIDAPYDALVARTQQRPVVRGAVCKTGALLFTISQGVAGVAMLALMLPDPKQAVQVAWPSVVMNFYYPWAKRHTHFAQYVLGVCLGWGVIVGTAGVLEAAQKGHGGDVLVGATRTSTVCLMAAAMLWTVIYDTIYAFQDMECDIKIGLKSTAVLFGQWTKAFLMLNLVVLVGLLTYVGYLNGLTELYYLFAAGGCLMSLGTMIVKVDPKDSGSCWWWFRYGFWLAGGSIAVGLLSGCFL